LEKIGFFLTDKWKRKIVANNYWSSSENSSTNAYKLNFNNGNVNNNNKSNSNYVRCVRGKSILRAIAAKFNSMTDFQQLPLYLKLFQLVKILYKLTRSFPREYKYIFGKEILNLAWECLDMVLEANTLYEREKNIKIAALSVCFDKFKIRLRMAQELKLISEKQFCHLQSYYLKEIGEMIGGWLKWGKQQT